MWVIKIRSDKQSYAIGHIGVSIYDRLKNMAILVLSASYFAAVWPGTKTKLNIPATHAMEDAKRLFGIPDFRYYALAGGIKAIFKRIGKGPLHPEGYENPTFPQLSLWSG